jgi:hypothetical protein
MWVEAMSIGGLTRYQRAQIFFQDPPINGLNCPLYRLRHAYSQWEVGNGLKLVASETSGDHHLLDRALTSRRSIRKLEHATARHSISELEG